jgi:ABC-type phosphate/phosphonate transport system permease subunit
MSLAKRLGFVAKLFAEGIEEIDRGQVEAVTATGAGGTKVSPAERSLP